MQESPEGEPLAVLLAGEWQPVALARGCWLIDQHWWRGQEVRRAYYRLTPQDGATLTVFLDRNSGQWFQQEY